jgi:hypothetical protein
MEHLVHQVKMDMTVHREQVVVVVLMVLTVELPEDGY